MTNRDVIQAMEKPRKISARQPIDEDESGLQEVSAFDLSMEHKDE